MYDKSFILKVQKNKDPYLFIDSINELKLYERVSGYKDLKEDEWFFKVHWEGDPNMPGFLQCEAIVQTTAIAILGDKKNHGKIVYLSKINKANFFNKITPNNRIIINGEITSYKRGIAKCYGSIHVNGKKCSSIDFEFVFPEDLNKFKKNS